MPPGAGPGNSAAGTGGGGNMAATGIGTGAATGSRTTARRLYTKLSMSAGAAASGDSGDKLRVVVFGQEGLTNTYIVDATGKIAMPLIGAVSVRGCTTAQASRAIADKLRNGFVRNGRNLRPGHARAAGGGGRDQQENEQAAQPHGTNP